MGEGTVWVFSYSDDSLGARAGFCTEAEYVLQRSSKPACPSHGGPGSWGSPCPASLSASEVLGPEEEMQVCLHNRHHCQASVFKYLRFVYCNCFSVCLLLENLVCGSHCALELVEQELRASSSLSSIVNTHCLLSRQTSGLWDGQRDTVPDL